MDQTNKLRVAMICYFSNPDVRQHLPLDNRKIYNLLRRVMHLPSKSIKYGDLAPWTTSTINFFHHRTDIELCTISPHSGLKKSEVSYKDENIHYHFVACDLGNFLGKIIKTGISKFLITSPSPICKF